MNDVVERVARAMLADELKHSRREFDQVWSDESTIWLSNARAAIEAMREPTEAMMIAGGRIAAGLSSGRAIKPYEDDAANIWSAMLSAALADASLDGEKN